MFERVWRLYLRRKRTLPWGILTLFLLPASLIYRLGYSLLRILSTKPHKVAVPVISVGNLTVGGTGKTPTVHLLAQGLLERGMKVGIVSSGYGRNSCDPIMSPGYKLQNENAERVGDEIRLLADLLPEAQFAVHESKAEAARMIAESGRVDLIIVDDGFQHSALARDIDIITYDATIPEKMLTMIPYGVLREPLTALKRADFVIITRTRFAKDIKMLSRRVSRINQKAELYHAAFEAKEIVNSATRKPVKYLADKSVFLFAGIGNFGTMRKQVTSLCADLDCGLELSDHQEYDSQLLESIKRRADKLESDVILTTGKDWVKLRGFDFGRESYYLSLSIDLDPGEEKLMEQLVQKLDLSERRANG